MKRIFTITGTLLLAGMLGQACSDSGEQASRKRGKDFGEQVFDAIKAEDHEALYAYAITEEDEKFLLQKAALSEEKRTQAESYLDYAATRWKMRSADQLQRLKANAAEEGIAWQELSYDSTVYDKIFVDHIWKSDIYVYLHTSGEKCILKLDDCLQSERGWVLVDDLLLWKTHPNTTHPH